MADPSGNKNLVMEKNAAELEKKVAEEMALIDAQKNTKQKEVYTQIIETATLYNQKLKEYYNELALMKLDMVKLKLQNLKSAQALEALVIPDIDSDDDIQPDS